MLNFDALDPWEDVDMTPDGTGALPDAVDTLADADTLDTVDTADAADAVDVDDDEVVVEPSFTADDSTTEDSIDTASDDA